MFFFEPGTHKESDEFFANYGAENETDASAEKEEEKKVPDSNEDFSMYLKEFDLSTFDLPQDGGESSEG